MSFWSFVSSQLFTRIPEPTTSFEGQTVIVTGSNVGLGLEAVRSITKLGASKVIIAVRSLEKGEAAKRSIEESTKCNPSTIEVWQLDLSSYDSVKEFAARASKLPRLDVLLENAGIATATYRVAENNESTITVNVISTFLLALLLLPKLHETASRFKTNPHLVIVSSDVHFWPTFAEGHSTPPGKLLETLNDKSIANMGERYPISKLLEVFFVRELAARSPLPSSSDKSDSKEQSEVIINTLTPGFCHSELAREAGWGLWFWKQIFARPTAVGARTLVHAAGAGRESHGQYLADCRVADVAPVVRNDRSGSGGLGKVHARIWEEVLGQLEGIQPGIGKIVGGDGK